MSDEVESLQIPPYPTWKDDPDYAAYELAQMVLGTNLRQQVGYQLKLVRSKFEDICPGVPSDKLDSLYIEAGKKIMYSLMMALDGISPSYIDEKHRLSFRVIADVIGFGDQTKTIFESIDLTDGDGGMCAAFHGWWDAAPQSDSYWKYTRNYERPKEQK